jgi:tetratricopeptide (TPR) repeat protein/putative hemolysin
VCFSPDGRRLASAGDDGAEVWEAQTGQEILTLRGHTGAVSSVCFSPDGRRLATASTDRAVRVWEAQTGQELLSLQGHTGPVTSVCFSPDGRRLATTTTARFFNKGEVKVWEAHTGQELLTLQGHTNDVRGVCFSPDGRRLATAGGFDVKVLEVQIGQETCTLEGHTGPVTRVGFSADGTRVVAADAQGRMHSWDTQTGQEVVPCTDLPPPTGQLQAASPDGHWIVRIDKRQAVVEPRVLHTGDLFRQRLADPVGTYLWHLGTAREARTNQDAFALAFHLEPLLLTSFTQRGARPRDTFSLWARRPPLIRTQGRPAVGAVSVTADQLRWLVGQLSQRLDPDRKAWEAWAARGWCRHLLGDLPGAVADLQKAVELHPDEPGLWAVLGTVYLEHHRLAEAEAVHRRLAGWAGVDVAGWDSVEADAGEQEGDWDLATWHLDHWLAGLPSACPQLLIRRGHVALESGRDQDAAQDYAAAVRAGRTDLDTLTVYARLALATGNREAYRKSCAVIVERVGTPNDGAWSCALGPEALPNLKPAVALARAAVQTSPGDGNIRNTLGAILYRAGQYREAVTELNQAVRMSPQGGTWADFLFLALAHQRLGDIEAARHALEHARFRLDAEAPLRQAANLLGGGTAGLLPATVAAAMLEDSRPRWDAMTRLEIRILRREAEEALGECRR